MHPCETPRLSGRSERCSRALAPTHSADRHEGGATLGSSATASRIIESADTSVTGGCRDCGALRTELQTALALLCDARERVRAREREVLALQHQHAHERARIREHYEALLRPLLQQKLRELQLADGSWRNEKNDRWWEGQKLVCTVYALLALERCQ